MVGEMPLIIPIRGNVFDSQDVILQTVKMEKEEQSSFNWMLFRMSAKYNPGTLVLSSFKWVIFAYPLLPLCLSAGLFNFDY